MDVSASLAKHIALTTGFSSAAQDDAEEEQMLSHRCVLTARTL